MQALLFTFFFYSSPAQALTLEQFQQQASTRVNKYSQKLLKSLQEGIQEGFPKGIKSCNTLIKKLKREDIGPWQIGRTSLRLRNAANAPRAWAAPFLALGQHTDSNKPMKDIAFKTQSGFAYVRPIYTKALCLGCHGQKVLKPVRKALSAWYPKDQATGYKMGQFRGLFWVHYDVPTK